MSLCMSLKYLLSIINLVHVIVCKSQGTEEQTVMSQNNKVHVQIELYLKAWY